MILTRMLRRIFCGNSANPPASIPVAASSVGDHVIRRLPKLTTPALDRLSNFFMPLFWGTSNPEAVTAAAKQIVGLSGSAHHFADNFLTWGRNMSMLDDRPFVQAHCRVRGGVSSKRTYGNAPGILSVDIDTGVMAAPAGASARDGLGLLVHAPGSEFPQSRIVISDGPLNLAYSGILLIAPKPSGFDEARPT